MAVHRVTVSLDEQAWKAAENAAQTQGESLSAWLSEAARDKARIQEGLRGVAEYEAEYGAPTAEELEMTRKELSALGFGQPVPPDAEAQWQAAERRLRGDDDLTERLSA